MLTLGEVRPFWFHERSRIPSEKYNFEPLEVMLYPNMLVRITKEANDSFEHSRPKYSTDKPSMSFTFRHVPE